MKILNLDKKIYYSKDLFINQKKSKKVLEISRKGLISTAISNSSRGRKDEAHFLDPLFVIDILVEAVLHSRYQHGESFSDI